MHPLSLASISDDNQKGMERMFPELRRHVLILSVAVLCLSVAACVHTGEKEAATSSSLHQALLPYAHAGDPEAQLALGTLYVHGDSVPQDYTQAARWYRLAAEQGNAQAQFNLGYLYDFGKGVSQDYTLAAHWYRLAAEQGNAPAQFSLGCMYQEGEGVSQDYAQAALLYRLAAEQGNPKAQNNLGFLYGTGRGVPQNYELAAAWYHRAAAQGAPTAQYNLGMLYFRGNGMPRDLVLAHTWFNLAAAAGSTDAAAAREVAARSMTPAQIAAAQALATEWRPQTEGHWEIIDDDSIETDPSGDASQRILRRNGI